MSQPKEKRDWKKIVSESNGERAFLPDGFKSAAKEIEETRVEYNKDVIKMARKEIAMNMATQNLFYDLRKHLEKSGFMDIWVKDIGFEVEALSDGEFVVNISDPKRR